MLPQSADFPHIWKVAGYKLKLQSVSIQTDQFSNLVAVSVVYRLPFFASKAKIINAMYSTLPKKFVYVGWNDANCKTIAVMKHVIPNGGKVIYMYEGDEK